MLLERLNNAEAGAHWHAGRSHEQGNRFWLVPARVPSWPSITAGICRNSCAAIAYQAGLLEAPDDALLARTAQAVIISDVQAKLMAGARPTRKKFQTAWLIAHRLNAPFAGLPAVLVDMAFSNC